MPKMSSQNISMLTSVLTEKLTKNKKVFGSTIDKILEVDIKLSHNMKNYPFQSERSLDGIPKILKVAFEVVAKQKNLVQEGIYRQNGNMNLILGLKLVGVLAQLLLTTQKVSDSHHPS